MKLLVTGGAGFIGSNFIRYILNKYPDYEVINLDKLTYAGNLANLKDIEGSRNYRFVKGDISDPALVAELMGEVDMAVNFAAESHVDRSIESSDEFVLTNVLGVNNLLKNALDNKIRRFIQISTDEVYGSVDIISFKEEDKLTPSSPYSATKAAGDLLALSYFKTHEFPVIVTRSSNNFGPYQYPEKLIPFFVTNLMEDKKVPLYGDGLNVRDWLYVTDNCAAIDIIMHKGENGQIYNIGAGNEVSNIDITMMVLELLGKNMDYIESAPDRRGHDRRYSVDISKITELGWEPERGFEENFVTTINWYKENKSWWKPLKKA
ncbi:MAG: dTDP-glucose 4,6-dehydratase [Actinomycetota bacterium]|nr:dTDP-glucose 4,6-dehydratase [Actinomycetota bacterium]